MWRESEEMVKGGSRAQRMEKGEAEILKRKGRRGVFGWREIRVVCDNYSLNLP